MPRPNDKIIFPLDLPDVDQAKRYIDLLAGQVGVFKVGLELFIAAGPQIVRYLTERDLQVFLDLKLLDIPTTVNRAMGRVADLGVTMATVHAAGGPEMLAAAVEGADGRVGVLAVTVLTSMAQAEGQPDIPQLVMVRAQMAHSAGCWGVVCAAPEAQSIKTTLDGQMVTVTPGIRLADNTVQNDDQQRVMTPARALQNGADYLVIGRPIRDAQDPRAVVRRIADEMAAATA